MDDRPDVPIAVVMPVLQRRTLTPAEGGPVGYQVPGIAFEHGSSMYRHALRSVYDQTVEPAGGIHVALDVPGGDGKHGAGPTRAEALRVALSHLDHIGMTLEQSFVSFIDDDDLWYPNHLETHWRLLQEAHADVAYSWFDGNDPFPMHRGRVFDPKDPHHITTTITVRASLAQQAAHAFDIDAMHQDWSGEDWKFILNLIELGARFVGTGEKTWHYRVHYGNTSGLPNKGDALQ